MAGEKLEYVKEALVSLADLLQDEDRITLIIYDDDVQTIYSRDYYSINLFDRASYLNAVEEIVSGGSTNLEGGLRAGLTEVLEQTDTDYANRVILLSDGLANVGVTDADSLAEIVKRETNGNITVSTIGVGADYDEKIMTSIATAGRGHYYFLENPVDAERIFEDEFKTLTEIVASDIKVTFNFQSQFVVTRGIGYDLQTDGYFEPFDLYSGRNASYLFQIDKNVAGDISVDDLQKNNLLRLTLTFTSKLDGSEQTIDIPLNVEIVKEEVNPLASDIVYKEFINSIKSEELWTIYEDLDKVDNETARRNLRELIEFYKQANVRLEGSLDSDIQILEEKYKYLESIGENDINIEYSGRVFQKSNQNDSYRDKYNK
jgi:Ca-activated chloride channel family protein